MSLLRYALMISTMMLVLLPAAIRAAPATPEIHNRLVSVESLWETSGGPGLPLQDTLDVAVAPDGNVWITDGHNNRFQIFSPDGTFREAWGTPGSGDGEFNFQTAYTYWLGSLAFAPDGSFYVADSGNDRIQHFSAERSFLSAWGSHGLDDGQFLHAWSVVVGSNGYVYVVDDQRNDVQVFDTNGTFAFKFSGPGASDGLISDPGALAIAPNGDVLVADSGNDRVSRFSANGQFLMEFGKRGTEPGQFTNPVDVAVDTQGRVFVTDLRNYRVQVFDKDGVFLGMWGELGREPGQFMRPYGLTVDAVGDVYVSEFVGEHRVQKFHPVWTGEISATPER